MNLIDSHNQQSNENSNWHNADDYSWNRKVQAVIETAYSLHVVEHPLQPLFLNGLDWIGLSSVLRPRQHSIGYMGDGF